MNKLNSTFTLSWIIIFIIYTQSLNAQNTYTYPLINDFSELNGNAPDLIPLANGNGETGAFQDVNAPENLCPNDEFVDAYYFFDNAGLQFDNSGDLIGCEYTIEFVFNHQTLPGGGILEPQWHMLLNFKDGDDGLFIHKNIFFPIQQLQLWDSNTNLQQCDFSMFNTVDWFKFTLIRDCNGNVDIYLNCQFLCSMIDENDILNPTEVITWFQDDPEILLEEASPGFVRNIELSDFQKTSEEIAEGCNCICGTANSSCVVEVFNSETTCDETEAGIFTENIPAIAECSCDTLITTEVEWIMPDEIFLEDFTCKPDEAGLQIDSLINQLGCDSLVFTEIVLATDSTFFEGTTCDPDEAGLQIEILTNEHGCDSFIITNNQLLPSDTLYFFETTCEEDEAGIFTNFFTNQFGCDSLEVTEISFAGLPALSSLLITPDNGNQMGSIQPSISGGAMPLTFSWNTGATTQNLNNLESGFYELTVTDANDCESIFEFEVPFVNALEELGITDFQLFPNPVSEDSPIFLKIETTQFLRLPIKIFDARGVEIWKEDLKIQTGNSIIELPKIEVSGIYFLQIVEESKVIEKIIVSF